MDYRELLIWQRAMDLCEEVYRVTATFPGSEAYGLTVQLRKSAASIPSNIAEGEGRLTRGERRQFLSQARGSLFEVDTQIELASRFRYVQPGAIVERIMELRRMLDAYIAYVRK
jgi:four helix bundle protein